MRINTWGLRLKSEILELVCVCLDVKSVKPSFLQPSPTKGVLTYTLELFAS